MCVATLPPVTRADENQPFVPPAEAGGYFLSACYARQTFSLRGEEKEQRAKEMTPCA